MSYCPGCGDEIQDDTSTCQCTDWEMTNCAACGEHRANHDENGSCDHTNCTKFVEPKRMKFKDDLQLKLESLLSSIKKLRENEAKCECVWDDIEPINRFLHCAEDDVTLALNAMARLNEKR